jgi:uncharacterized OB-fold protein
MRFDEVVKKYKELLAQEKLPYIHCKSCNKNFYYPRPKCLYCGSEDIEIKISKGIGKIFSFTKFNKDGSWVCYGIVELDEGFRMYSNFDSDVEMGERVMVKFILKEGQKIPIFTKLMNNGRTDQ